MADHQQENLLARLAGRTPAEAAKTWADIAAKQPQHAAQPLRTPVADPAANASPTAPMAAAPSGGPPMARAGQFTLPGTGGRTSAPPPAAAGAAPTAVSTGEQPKPTANPPGAAASISSTPEGRLEQLMKRIGSLTTPETPVAAKQPITSLVAEPQAGNATSVLTRPPAVPVETGFYPPEPQSFDEAKVTASQVEAIILRYMLVKGNQSGRDVSDQLKLSFKMIDDLLRQMKTDQLVVYSGTAPMSDYYYQLTDMGRERGRRFTEECSYFGSAPVCLDDYIKSVKAQSLCNQHPTEENLKAAFEDLLINKHMLNRLGPAINSGRGLFLYGAPGNGKTSIAERITKAFGDAIWIPRAIEVDGQIIRLFDPSTHEAAPLEQNAGLLDQRKIDKRWIRIRRPTIVVGGELTMDNLEVTLNTSTGICEAPLQMKSNCGTLVIDDFGRQRMRTDELLNRWIVPLEKRYDFLNLPNGKKIQVPFDQLIVFSTNLQPKDLVDDAFLRRIPYKIDVIDPSEDEFRDLFRIMCPKTGIEFRSDALDYLIETHYRRVKRPFRCCQPRDLLLQIRNLCLFKNIAPEMTRDNFDFAAENYFAVM